MKWLLAALCSLPVRPGVLAGKDGQGGVRGRSVSGPDEVDSVGGVRNLEDLVTSAPSPAAAASIDDRRGKKKKSKMKGKSKKRDFTSCDPSKGDIFVVLDDAISFERGVISARWFSAQVVPKEDAVDTTFACEDIVYHLFVAPEGFDFSGKTLLELQQEASQASSSSYAPASELVEVETTELEARIEGLTPGTFRDGLIIVSGGSGSVVSENREKDFTVEVGARDYRLNPSVTRVVGPISASDELSITINELPSASSPELTIEFSGSSIPGEIENLAPGEHVVGFTSADMYYVVRLLGLQSRNPTSIVWAAQKATLSDIFDELELSGAIGSSELFAQTATRNRRDLQRQTPDETRMLQDDEEDEFEISLPIGGGFRPSFRKKLFDGLVTVAGSLNLQTSIEFKVQIGDVLVFDDVIVGGSVVLSGSADASLSVEIKDNAKASGSLAADVWRGPKIRRIFFVGPVPFLLELQPSMKAFVGGNIEVEAGGKMELSMEQQVRVGASYFGSWDPIAESRSTTPGTPLVSGFPIDVAPSGSVGVGASGDAGFTFEFEGTIDGVIVVSPSIDIGTGFNIDLKTPSTLQDPPLYADKFDIAIFLRFPLKVALDLPFLPSFENEFSTGKFNFPLIALPKIKIKNQLYSTCKREGEAELVPLSDVRNAVYLQLSMEFEDPSLLFENPAGSPIKWITDQVESADSRIQVIGTKSDRTLTLVIPRSEIAKGSKNIALPSTDLFVRPTARFPDFHFALFNSTKLDDFSEVEPFECCDSRDCNDGEICDSGECKQVQPTSAPTISPAPTPAPTPPPTLPPIVPALPEENGATRVTSDPHFVTWRGFFSYQGACDLVFIRNRLVEIHVQTSFGNAERRFSFVSAVAIAIGGDVLEVHSNATYFINRVVPSSPPETIGGGFPFTATGGIFQISLSGNQAIRVSFYRSTITLDVLGHISDFGDSVGLMGPFNSNVLYGRDGNSTFTEIPDYAREWAVNASLGDPILLIDAPVNNTCRDALPFTTPPGLLALAERQCEGLDRVSRDFCVFDIIATEIDDWMDPGVFNPVEEPEPLCRETSTGNETSSCAEIGGRCVWRCDPSQDTCIQGLCEEVQNITVFDSNSTRRHLQVVEGCSCAVTPTLPNDVVNQVITCISVIDESSGQSPAYFANLWSTFRSRYPHRPFCLLQPRGPNIRPADLKIPQAFFDDNNAVFAEVSRDNGVVADRSDWFDICRLGPLRAIGISNVAIFIDNSGSLTTPMVRASYEFLRQRMNISGLALVSGEENRNEDWLSPFVRDFLVPQP